MSLILNEQTIALWFLVTIPGKQDFLGSLYTADDGELEFQYRFRYWHSADPHDAKDKKSWYVLRTKKDSPKKHTKEEMLSNIRYMVHMLEEASGNKADEILYKGDYKAFFEEFKSKPWAHMREATKEEAGEA